MKVTLATSPHIRHPSIQNSNFQPQQSKDLYYRFFPIGLLSLAGAVQDNLGFLPKLFDTNSYLCTLPLDGTIYDLLALELLIDSPNIIGFMTDCDSFHHVLMTCNALRRHDANVKIILGGPQASSVAIRTLNLFESVDAIAIGEGENSFVAWLQNIISGIQAKVPGIIERLSSGQIINGGTANLVENLDELPALPLDLYSPLPNEEIFIEVGRGCPYSCTFCSTSVFWQRHHRVKSSARILCEIKNLIEKYEIKRVHFTHDLFTVNRKWVLSICEALSSANLGVKWTCSSRTDLVDKHLLSEMKAAGCDAIYFGIESGDIEILNAINKSISIEHSISIINDCIKIGIRPNAGLILGHREETATSFAKTLDLFFKLQEMGVAPCHLFVFCPFSGAPSFSSNSEYYFDGHFLDIPLGNQTSLANLNMIEKDKVLFSSYHRPISEAYMQLPKGYLAGIDEFSPLVEGAKLATLRILSKFDCSIDFYSEWIAFISMRNLLRKSSQQRFYYGSFSDYLDFLLSILNGESDEDKALQEHIDLKLKHSEIGQSFSRPYALTFETYKSSTNQETLSGLSINSEIKQRSLILRTKYVFDPSIYLNWEPRDPIPAPVRKATDVVWSISSVGQLNVIMLNDFQCILLDILLENDNITIGEIYTKMVLRQNAIHLPMDLLLLEHEILKAHRIGLLSIIN